MSLYRVDCSCGWSCYRHAASVDGRSCPGCGQKSLRAAPVPEDQTVVVHEPNGRASRWSPAENRWVAH